MAVFLDASGQEWQVRLTSGAVTRLRTDAGLDLNKAADGGPGFADLLLPDAESFAAGLWVLVRDQAERLGVTRDVFMDRLDGDVMDAAATALIAAAVDFFPKLRKTAIRGRLPEVMAMMAGEVAARTGAALDTAISGWSASATSSPPSAGSTPAPSASVSLRGGRGRRGSTAGTSSPGTRP